MEGRCTICNEGITNPVCIKCLDRGIRVWVWDRPELLKRLDAFTKIFSEYDEENSRCILCKGEIAICAHCYCWELYKELKKADSRAAEGFLEHFNYDIKVPCRFS